MSVVLMEPKGNRADYSKLRSVTHKLVHVELGLAELRRGS